MSYQSIYEAWVADPRLAEADRAELKEIAADEKEKEYRFGGELAFGTAGMRGIIGCGMNMMNVYTVMRATQGLSEYIKTLPAADQAKGVVISYDTRRNSRLFAQKAAGVLAKNGIKAYLFDDVHPVPMLSYAVRYLGTIAGIMITASHNPKEYNGYKVYGEDGAQMSPEATEIVVGFIEKIKDYLCVTGEDKSPLIVPVPKEVDDAYIAELKKLTLSKEAVEKCGKDLKLVYTPVHGSGYVPVTTILKKLKINVTVVPEQVKKDTEFSTVEVPNPEFKETLSKGIALAEKIQADVVFGTDPDRPGVGRHFVAHLHAEGGCRKVGLRVHVAEVDLAVEIAETVAAVERNAHEVRVVVDLQRGAFGFRIARADRHRRADALAVAERHVRTEHAAVEVGRVA